MFTTTLQQSPRPINLVNLHILYTFYLNDLQLNFEHVIQYCPRYH
jgi:hypothetical protein